VVSCRYIIRIMHGDHLYGKPRNFMNLTAVSEISDFAESHCQGSVREKILSGKSGLKLFIVSCILVSILDFAEFVRFILVTDHAVSHSYPHH